ncbi:MAG: Hpt domain-containing protein [Gammaproteobacteria bacterium]|nr:Hpt domain-containing protein [Gammaproteobacteria bacterium]
MNSDISDRLELLKKQYADTFVAKRAEFAAALDLVRSGAPEGIDTLRHLAHKLAGSGASYGFVELSGLAKRVEGAAIARQESHSGSDAGGELESRCQILIEQLDIESSNG